MDLESLRCFLAVAETLHFRAAAERVALSPAAVSDRIRRLEEDVGVSLFGRTTRRVQLSDAGRRLVPHARKLLDEAARTSAVARGDQHVPPFELTIGTRYELGVSWLCPTLAPLAAARPERTLHLYMGDGGVLLDRLERGSIDACVLSARLTRPHVRYALLHEERYAFVGVGPGPRCAEEASAFTLVDATPDLPLFRYLLDALPEGSPWRFRHNLYVGGIAAIRYMVSSGQGVAVLPRYFVQADLDAGRVREILPETVPRSDWFRLLWRADNPREDELVQLSEALRTFPLR
jgi:DNA-binding transcriptional LysR family regulator